MRLLYSSSETSLTAIPWANGFTFGLAITTDPRARLRSSPLSSGFYLPSWLTTSSGRRRTSEAWTTAANGSSSETF
ncbi:hypothetical protein CPLU01_00618 [Colletotrichum plurivorum]|uniref:Uncharacterized protein n=1 Tax=Colletotrichum plurivorum TaxID=2175906 RepID=A0A8H6NRX3_9PEZI|nr:hypothetical protein CPLU01_00618 [Colletotrichum plurivorum]